MRRLEHCNIVKLKYFFYSSGEKVCIESPVASSHSAAEMICSPRRASEFLVSVLEPLDYFIILLSHILAKTIADQKPKSC